LSEQYQAGEGESFIDIEYSGEIDQMADRQQVEKLLKRILKGGQLGRLPRSRKDTEIFLALAASTLDPQGSYSEAEVNEFLSEWLVQFATLDHVTLRRYMVDHSLLHRDTFGTTYRTNQTIINKIIDPEARSILPSNILEALEREREQRKRELIS